MKPWYTSLTVLGILVSGMIQVFEANAIVPTGVTTNVAQIGSLLMALIGRFRAQGPLA